MAPLPWSSLLWLVLLAPKGIVVAQWIVRKRKKCR